MSVDTRSRPLTSQDFGYLRELLERDPVESVLVAARLEGSPSERERAISAMWGYPGERMESVCYFGPNLIPLYADEDAIDAFADVAINQGRTCSSIVGSSDAVGRLWGRLSGHWGPARLIRWHQPVMAIDTPARTEPNDAVRLATASDYDLLFDASVAMYSEEIGVSPLIDGGLRAYQRRVRELIARNRAFVHIDGDRVLFKAELGAVSGGCAQIQGVWVEPELRGQGYGTSGTAAVVNAALAAGNHTVSLYVNDFNEAAVRSYRSVGFREVGDFMTVLF